MSVQHSPPHSENKDPGDEHGVQFGPRTLAQAIPGDFVGNELSVAHHVRLPPFWRENPALWFAQCESVFALNRIAADETRYRYVIANLDPTVLPFVSDLLTRPPSSDKYLALKTRIVNTFEDSAETKLRRVLRGNEFRDERPSCFFQRLRNLAGGQCGDSVLRALFLEQLPENVRAILALSEVTDLAKLAAQADKIIEAVQPTVAAISDGVPSSRRETTIEALASRVEALTREMNQLRVRRSPRRGRFRARSKSSSQPRGRLSSRDSSGDNKRMCYYHATFGVDARKCRSPCSWTDASGN